MMEPLRIVFAGTPEFAARHLECLLDRPDIVRVVAVYSQPDRPAGRGKRASPSPVKVLAQRHGLPVRQPASLRDGEAQTELAALAADVMVVVAYGLILPQAVLDLPRLGCINVHASLLPRWRGAAPIQRAIEAGDRETGITIMQMDAGLDTGPMLDRVSCTIEPTDTTASLQERLAALGGPALLSTLTALATGAAHAQAQNDALSCYAPKIDKTEAAIDWRRPASALARHIRALAPTPAAFAELDAERIKILAATAVSARDGAPGVITAAGAALTVACGEGSLAIHTLQLPGGKPLPVSAILNGHAARLAPGRRFAVADDLAS